MKYLLMALSNKKNQSIHNFEAGKEASILFFRIFEENKAKI